MVRKYRRKKGSRRTQTWQEGQHVVVETRWETTPLVDGETKKRRGKKRKQTFSRFL